MISRIWHGWTTPGNADRYESLLSEEILISIQRRRIPGFKGIQLLRREAGGEVDVRSQHHEIREERSG
jgi:heme-degrading monooxygenase HmoA